jgi:hypothetical protein
LYQEKAQILQGFNDIEDDEIIQLWNDQIVKKISVCQYLIVSVFSFYSQPTAYRFIQQIRQKYSDIKILVGGIGSQKKISNSNNAQINKWISDKFKITNSNIFGELLLANGMIDSWQLDMTASEIEEKRFSLHARRYTSSSFHFIFGAVLNDLKAELGDDILDAFGAELSSGIRLQNLGLSLGMGNRWHWKNGITAGIDWMRVNVPLLETKLEDEVLDDVGTSSDKKDVKEALKTFNRIPTFVLFGLNLGYSF